MANYHHATLHGGVDWPTLAAIVERELGHEARVTAIDASTGHIDFDRAGTGITSALFFIWPGSDAVATELTIREGGTALDVLRAVVAVTGGKVAASEEHEDWMEVPVTRPPVELTPDQVMAANLQRLFPLTLAVPLAAACADQDTRARLEGIMSMRRLGL